MRGGISHQTGLRRDPEKLLQRLGAEVEKPSRCLWLELLRSLGRRLRVDGGDETTIVTPQQLDALETNKRKRSNARLSPQALLRDKRRWDRWHDFYPCLCGRIGARDSKSGSRSRSNNNSKSVSRIAQQAHARNTTPSYTSRDVTSARTCMHHVL